MSASGNLQVYGIGGMVSVGPPVLSGATAPTIGHPPAKLGQNYFDTSTNPPDEYIFNGVEWALSGSSSANEFTADSGTAIPAAGNINLVGGAGIVTSASGDTVTFALTGGGTAIDSFVPDAGTNPVVPTAGGAVTMAGTANQITTTGGTNSLTFSVPTTFIAPGSIASTSTITAATSLTSTLGNITATNGNLVLGTAGNKLSIATGANASTGTATLVGGTLTVNTSAVTASSLVHIWRQSIGATGAAALGQLTVGTITAGTSFVINAVQAADATALQASDVSVIGWMIVN